MRVDWRCCKRICNIPKSKPLRSPNYWQVDFTKFAIKVIDKTAKEKWKEVEFVG